MTTIAAPPRVTWAAAVPPLVRDALRGPDRHGVVLGVHPTAVYIGVGEHDEVLGIVTSDGLALPIALRLGFAARDVASVGWGVVAGDRVLVGERGVVLPRADVVAAREQRPARVDGARDGALDGALGAGGRPRAGASSALSTRLGRHATAALVPRARSLAAAALAGGSVEDSLAGLVGLGRGLTPAGDDVVSGVVLTLRALGHGAAVTALDLALRPLLHRTTSLSAALLRAACEGWAAPEVERLVRGAATGRLGPADLHDVVAIGHSSGRDLLAGVLGTCLALHEPTVSAGG